LRNKEFYLKKIIVKKKLAIINADKAQIPLVKKAKEMGVETHCFAWDKEGYTHCKGIADYYHPISILEKEKILEKCKEINIDGVTSIRHDFSVPIVAYIAENMGLPGNRYDDMIIASGNKFTMRQTLSKNGVNCPRFAIANEGVDLSEFKYPLIVKPVDRCASIGIMKVNNDKELKEAIHRAKQLSYIKEAIIEEYITGKEVCALSISCEGEHYHLDIQDKVTSGPPYHVEIGHHQPADLTVEMQEKVKAETSKALTALNFNYGATDNELMIDENGKVFIIEINARMGGDCTPELVTLSTGYDFLKGLIDVALNQFEKPVLPIKKYSGIYYWSKETEYLKQIMDNKEKYPEIVEVQIDNEDLKFVQCSADRSGYLLYQADRRMSWKP